MNLSVRTDEWARYASAVLAALLFTMVGVSSARFAPVDPLVRPTSGAGGVAVSFGAGYTPEAAFAEDALFVRHEGSLSLGVTYNVTDTIRASVSGRLSGTHLGVSGSDGTVGEFEARLHGVTVGLESDLDGPFAPTVGLDVTLPWPDGWSAAAYAAASVLRDPVLLDAMVAYVYGPEFGNALTVSGGTAVVLNDDLTLRGDVTQTLAFRAGALVLPVTDLSVRGAFRLDEHRTLSSGVGVRSSLGGPLWRLVVGLRFRT